MRDKAYRRFTYEIHQKRWRTATSGNRYRPMAGYYYESLGRFVDNHHSTARVKLKRISNKRYRRLNDNISPKKMLPLGWILY